MQRDAHRRSLHCDDETVTYTESHSLGTTLTTQQHASRHDMQWYTDVHCRLTVLQLLFGMTCVLTWNNLTPRKWCCWRWCCWWSDDDDDVHEWLTMLFMPHGSNKKHISLSIWCYRPDNIERVCYFIVQIRRLCTIDWLMQHWTSWWDDGLMFVDDEWWHFTAVQLSLEVARSYGCQDPTVARIPDEPPHATGFIKAWLSRMRSQTGQHLDKMTNLCLLIYKMADFSFHSQEMYLQHCIEASLTVFIHYGSQKICLGVCLQNSIH